MKKTTVLHIKSGEWIVGGIEELIVSVYDALKNDFTFDFYSVSYLYGDFNSPYAEKVRDFGGQMGIFDGRQLYNGKLLRNLDSFFSKNKYDIVHIHLNPSGMMMPQLVSFYAKKHNTKKIIFHAHGTALIPWIKSSLKHKIATLLLPLFFSSKPDLCVACSDMAGERTFGKRPFEFVRNGIDLIRFKYDLSNRKKIRDEFKIEDDTFLIGHIGRMDFIQKNQSFLLDIFAEFIKQKPKSKLLLVGDGETRQILEEKVRCLGLEKSVVFTGTRHDANAFYSAFDCFVLPSFFEGLPVVAVEAQASGLPILFTDSVSRQSQIRNLTQFLSLKAPLSHWVDAIETVCNMPNNRETAYLEEEVQKWSIQDTANHFKKLYGAE